MSEYASQSSMDTHPDPPAADYRRARCPDSPDLFVVGGGPAGLAFAILAAQRGLRVAVADHNRPPIDKACGEGLMPDTLASINALGITFDTSEGSPFVGIRFCDANTAACAQAGFGHGFGIGIRRTLLHSRLVERASALGVMLLWSRRISFAASDRIFCDGRPVHSKWVIGADGEASQFRKWSRLDRKRYEQIRFSARRHFRMTPWSDFAEVYWGRSCQIVVAPVASDELCIAVTSRNPLLRFHNALAQVPMVTERLRDAPPANAIRGARVALRRLSQVYHGRFALIGDASGSVDPLTGEGIGLALKQAAALVDAITSDDLPSYQAAHDRISRLPRLMSRLMLIMDGHPRLRRRALQMLAAEPSLFSQLLNVNVGNLALSNLQFLNLLRLSWHALIPRPLP